MYLVKTPWWLRKLYPTLTWQLPGDEKVLYLTFDDGPHETATPFILDCLRSYNAKGTFFCIGKNVQQHPSIYRRIIEEGHNVGNHTHNHLNGWKTRDREYMDNINQAASYIDSRLFRPPYGRIGRFQANFLQQVQQPPYQVIMWSVLSGDFDVKISPEQCLKNVILSATPGSIIVFHDSTKAWERMKYALPGTLEHFAAQGFAFRSINGAGFNF
ncbi:polysaccharide deacetylase family protein [Filimonas effusa]|uniref:Polysaccharide deacetylase family protein n=1 Tax=Filimonas effusa TaxID=2508721 RepID=A0A4Q1D688_9BACT|nr:polysaccharide deacetylase family protein [Filimonas effusa]RXK83211.1 polysaccharide deacetylase family protein [Filimonas effusa]